jgi:hypothetical protein
MMPRFSHDIADELAVELTRLIDEALRDMARWRPTRDPDDRDVDEPIPFVLFEEDDANGRDTR